MKLANYVVGRWQDGAGEGQPLGDPVSGEVHHRRLVLQATPERLGALSAAAGDAAKRSA
ncbi:MAG TPA: hypothetical protein VMK05_06840 [Burkholderiales bacterium]|nr:hypothetical protein [Burkholderiales bacterium]